MPDFIVSMNTDRIVKPLDIHFIHVESWMIVSVSPEGAANPIRIMRGDVEQLEQVFLPNGATIITAAIDYFSIEALECRAGGFFYTLGEPNEEWFAELKRDHGSTQQFNQGYRLHA